MGCKRLSETAGVTLLELTIAVAIFAVALGASAQILVSFYSTMDIQNQRVMVINYCRGLMSDMRNLRDATADATNADACLHPTTFQERVLCRYAQGSLTLDLNPTTGRDRALAKLKSPSVQLQYVDSSPTANPLTPTIRVQWRDMRGHLATLALSSSITDR